jgi:hypothetical protein
MKKWGNEFYQDENVYTLFPKLWNLLKLRAIEFHFMQLYLITYLTIKYYGYSIKL